MTRINRIQKNRNPRKSKRRKNQIQLDLAIGKKMDAALISDRVLCLNNISIFRDDFPVVTNFSLALNSGDWVVIRGRNGCGKSTLLKSIVGLIPPGAGVISVKDYAYLGHANGLRDHLTVAQHLNFVAKWFGVSLKPTPVDHLKDLYIHQLSAGLKRQLALSQFILSPHRLWIMDEPLDNLDIHARSFFTDLMQSHIQNRGAILQTSHDVVEDDRVREVVLK